MNQVLLGNILGTTEGTEHSVKRWELIYDMTVNIHQMPTPVPLNSGHAPNPQYSCYIVFRLTYLGADHFCGLKSS